MNKLLPKIDEFKPITDKNSTFYECGFNTDFCNLPFEEKLKIVNDIIRQTILNKYISDPDTDTENLVGNCHTASRASIEYLKSLKIGKNYRYVFCKKKPFEPDDITTKHTAILVDDFEGNTYFFDAAPFVGYGIGLVKKLDNNQIYEDYEIIEGDKAKLLYSLEKIIFKLSKGTPTNAELVEYCKILNEAKSYPILDGMVSYCYELLSKKNFTKTERDKFLLKSISLNPYSMLSGEELKKTNLKNLIGKQIKIWQTELQDLISSGKNYKKQLMLAQNIVQENKRIDPSYELWFDYENEKHRYSSLTPRFFADNGLNVVLIKTSSYFLGVHASVKEAFLSRGNGVIKEYNANLALPTKATGIHPMAFSHTIGEKITRSVNGSNQVILLKRSSDEIKQIKRYLRSTVGKNLLNRDVKWYDGEKIHWDPFVTNLVHTTDNPSEACLHFLIAYPEHQLMTRFMYPNYKLEKESSHERI